MTKLFASHVEAMNCCKTLVYFASQSVIQRNIPWITTNGLPRKYKLGVSSSRKTAQKKRKQKTKTLATTKFFALHADAMNCCKTLVYFASQSLSQRNIPWTNNFPRNTILEYFQ